MIDQLFTDPVLSKPATYLPAGASVSLPVRVIAKQPDTVVGFGDGQLHVSTVLFDIRSLDIPEPAKGDQIVCEGIADTALIDAATDNTPLELAFAYTIDADKSLVFTAHEVYLPKPKLAISGPGGVQATFDWQAEKATSPARMLTVVLKNDVASYA